MDMSIIEFLQSIQTPVLDWFFYIITNLGDQYAFIVIAVILYWTYDKKYAHKFAVVFMLSALVNTALKVLFQRPRPYLTEGVEPPFGYETSGYSMPSGHAQAAGVFGYTLNDLSKKTKRTWLKWTALFIVTFVPISRVYLAQHYLSDVLVGLVLAIVLAHFLFKLMDKLEDKEELYTLYLVPLMLVLLPFIIEHDFYIAAGGFTGFAVGYFIEKRYVGYDVKAKGRTQVLKVIVGIVIALIIKEGLKLIFPELLFFDFLRYLMIGGWAALGAPYMFNYVFKSR